MQGILALAVLLAAASGQVLFQGAVSMYAGTDLSCTTTAARVFPFDGRVTAGVCVPGTLDSGFWVQTINATTVTGCLCLASCNAERTGCDAQGCFNLFPSGSVLPLNACVRTAGPAAFRGSWHEITYSGQINFCTGACCGNSSPQARYALERVTASSCVHSTDIPLVLLISSISATRLHGSLCINCEGYRCDFAGGSFDLPINGCAELPTREQFPFYASGNWSLDSVPALDLGCAQSKRWRHAHPF